MSFLYPGWLMLLLLLPLILLGAVLSQRRHHKAWQSMVAPRLRKQLVVEGSLMRRWVALILALAGCVLVIIAIARPYHGESTVTEQIRTRNILIAIDTSRSMLTGDVSPDRIGNARAMAIELKNAFPNDRIGIIAFSGAPVLMAPLTIDHTSIHETISQLDTGVIPSGGSDMAAAVQLAIETFNKSGHQANALVIISDGEDHSEQIQLAGEGIREAGIAVCTIGVGTSEGGIIPDPLSSDGKYRDRDGQTVQSRLNPDSLDQLARAGRGTYVPASAGADNAIRQALSFLEGAQESGRTVSIPSESYPWFLLPAIILLALAMLVRSNLLASRIPGPGAAASALALLMACAQPLNAATVIEEATAAYQGDDYQNAYDLFGRALAGARDKDRAALAFSRGSSAYRLQRWDLAANCFSRSLLSENSALQEHSHYNLANTLFQSGWGTLKPEIVATEENPFLGLMRRLYGGQADARTGAGGTSLTRADIQRVRIHWQDAIGHYRAALKLNPANANARDNLETVEKLLHQLRDAEEQARQEAEQEKQDKPKQDEQDQGDKQQDEGEQGDQTKQDPDQEGKPGSGDEEKPEQDDTSPPDESDPQENEPMDRSPDESAEAFAARILRELSDAETRPLTRRSIRLQRPAKDW